MGVLQPAPEPLRRTRALLPPLFLSISPLPLPLQHQSPQKSANQSSYPHIYVEQSEQGIGDVSGIQDWEDENIRPVEKRAKRVGLFNPFRPDCGVRLHFTIDPKFLAPFPNNLNCQTDSFGVFMPAASKVGERQKRAPRAQCRSDGRYLPHRSRSRPNPQRTAEDSVSRDCHKFRLPQFGMLQYPRIPS
jgi:hypothetical protein